jgi:hypothetical protein
LQAKVLFYRLHVKKLSEAVRSVVQLLRTCWYRKHIAWEVHITH